MTRQKNLSGAPSSVQPHHHTGFQLWGGMLLSTAMIALGFYFVIDLDRQYRSHFETETRTLQALFTLQYHEERQYAALKALSWSTDRDHKPDIASLRIAVRQASTAIATLPQKGKAIMRDVAAIRSTLDHLENTAVRTANGLESLSYSEQYEHTRDLFKAALAESRRRLAAMHHADRTAQVSRAKLVMCLGGGLLLFLSGTSNFLFYQQRKNLRKLAQSHVELQAARKDAEEAIQAKSFFLASISHEFRTPLNSILGFSQILRDEYYGNLNEEQRSYIEDITQSAEKINEMVSEVLALTKVETGRAVLECGPALPDEIFQRALFLVKDRALQCGVLLEVNLEQLPPLELDQQKIRHALSCQLDAAIRISSEGTRIQARLEQCSATKKLPEYLRGGPWAHFSITVEDANARNQNCMEISEPFSAIRHGQMGPGLGIGLALANKYAELHGGSGWCGKSEKDDAVIFHLALPFQSVCMISSENKEEGDA